jgi:hypothetical protein
MARRVGKIHIAKSKRGSFTRQAKRAHMSTQAFANKVLAAPKGKYSPATRKRANFARNFGGHTRNHTK